MKHFRIIIYILLLVEILYCIGCGTHSIIKAEHNPRIIKESLSHNHINKEVKIFLKEEKNISGKLLNINEDSIGIKNYKNGQIDIINYKDINKIIIIDKN